MRKIFTFLVIISFTCSIHSQSTIQNSSHFSVIDISTNDGNYTRLLTLTTVDDGNSSQEAQSFQINVTKLPEDGAYFRISKSTQNGSGFLSDPIDLALGLNTKTIAAATFNRYVKIQFGSADIEFDALTVNGDALNVSNQLGGSNLFDDMTNSNNAFTRQITLAKVTDGDSSQGVQKLDINITDLPDGGANYRVYKTTANGGDFFGPATALAVGENKISVTAVDFDRAVKIQFSGNNTVFSSVVANGKEQFMPNTIGSSLLFDEIIGNATWKRLIPLAAISDGTSSQGVQKLDINITDLPDGGANYRVYKTTASGSDNFGQAKALAVGENTISVTAVTFDRAVKIQFSKTDIKFNAISVNDITLESDNIIESNFEIYPNPASDKISIIGIENIKSVKIFNSLGALVKHTKNATSIDVSDLTKGIHFIEVDSGNIMTKKFIKK
jgi:hypothetical protein